MVRISLPGGQSDGRQLIPQVMPWLTLLTNLCVVSRYAYTQNKGKVIRCHAWLNAFVRQASTCEQASVCVGGGGVKRGG